MEKRGALPGPAAARRRGLSSATPIMGTFYMCGRHLHVHRRQEGANPAPWTLGRPHKCREASGRCSNKTKCLDLRRGRGGESVGGSNRRHGKPPFSGQNPNSPWRFKGRARMAWVVDKKHLPEENKHVLAFTLRRARSSGRCSAPVERSGICNSASGATEEAGLTHNHARAMLG